MFNTLLFLTIGLFHAAIVGGDEDKQQPPQPEEDGPLSRVERIMQLPAEDAELDPAVAAFLKHKEPVIWEDNANAYAWGAAYQTDDTYQLGLELSQKLRELNINHDYKEPMDTAFMDHLERLKALDEERLCSLIETGCLAQWLKILETETVLLDEFKVHQQRYLAFLRYTHFSEVASYSIHESSPILSLAGLRDGIRINHLDLMYQLKAGHTSQVVVQLENEATALRLRLSQADSIVPKMVIKTWYDHHINFIHAALTQKWLTHEQVSSLTSLKPLTAAQLSTRLAFASDERAILQMLQTVIKKENVELAFLTDMLYPGLVERMTKPNEFVNELYFGITAPILNIADMDAADFFQAYLSFDLGLQFDPELYPTKAMFDDTFSNDELRHKYLGYLARMFALDMKIQLLRAKVQEGSFDKVLEKAKQGHQPYLHHFDQSPPYIEDGAICYVGTKETTRRDWCLPLLERKDP